jgi:hypothetical protein
MLEFQNIKSDSQSLKGVMACGYNPLWDQEPQKQNKNKNKSLIRSYLEYMS